MAHENGELGSGELRNERPGGSGVDIHRRDIGALLGALGGALGLAALSGCAEAGGATRELTSTLGEDLNGTSNINWVDTVASLRALSGSSNWIAILEGYSSAGDGGGGVFVWSTTSATDDGGTILNSGGLGSSSAGWRRVYSGPLDIRWWNGSLSTAISAAVTLGQTLFMSPGSYTLTNVTVSAGPLRLQGAGRETTIIKQASNSSTSMLTMNGASLYASDLTFDGYSSSYGLATSGPTMLVFYGSQSTTSTPPGATLSLENCGIRNPVQLAIDASNVNVTDTVSIGRCEFRDANTSSHLTNPSQFINMSSSGSNTSNVDNPGNITFFDNAFVQSTVPTTSNGVAGIVLQGPLINSDPTGGSVTGNSLGLSAAIIGNYFYGVGTVFSGHPLGAVDVYNWVGKITIEGNRVFRAAGRAICVANSSAVVISGNTVTDAAYQFDSQAIIYSGATAHPGTQDQPFNDAVIANNVVRNWPTVTTQDTNGMFAIYVAGTIGTETRGVAISGNVIENCKGGIELYACGDVTIAANVIRNLSGSGIYDGSIQLFNCISDVSISGCHFYANAGYDVLAQTGNGALRLSVSNCVFYPSSAQTGSYYHVYCSGLAIVRATNNQFTVPVSGGGSAAHPITVASTTTAYLFENVSTNAPSLGATSLYHGGNSWDAASAAYSALNTANLTSQSLAAITCSGAEIGDSVVLGTQGFPSGVFFTGVVSTAGQVAVTLLNATGAALSSASGTVRVETSRHV